MGITNSSLSIQEKLINPLKSEESSVVANTNAEDTSIVCDYSRATQQFCLPADVCVGGICACICCTCGPIVSVLAICSSSSGHNQMPDNCFEGFGNTGNSIGYQLSRAFTRSLGFIVGLLCYPCEKINRNTAKAQLAGDSFRLFGCCYTREEVKNVRCDSEPTPLFELPDSVPPSHRMI